jgi:Yip1 domain
MDLVSRAINITRTPRNEWTVIAGEVTDIASLYTGYIIILAAIPLIAELLHLLILGLSIGIAIRIAVMSYFASLIDVAVVGFASQLLAPRFGGVGDRIQAFKLAAFGFTPSWLGGIFLLIPAIGWLLRLLCSIYSIYVYYLGIDELMGVPAEQRLPYFALVIVLSIVIGIVIALIIALIFGLSGMGTMIR